MKTIRKRMINFVLVCTVLMGLSILISQNAQAAESKFVVKKGTLVQYNGSDKNITIPKNVKTIKSNVFSGCSSLQTVVIPGNVKKIESRAFSECPNLKKVIMKNGVATIKEAAFCECGKLSSITIPKSVKKIEGYAFSETSWLTKKSKQRKDKLVIINHILVDGTKAKGKVKIPKGVNVITERAFFENTKVSSITIPSTVKTVGEYAFAFTNIKKITFPKSVKNIGVGALYGCPKLKEVTILNRKAKIMRSDGYEGDTIFDGMSSGLIGDKIVIRGYKNSTAAKFVKYMNKLSEWSDSRRYKKAVFKVVK